ncbi:MAG: hypothetical protein IPJ13_09105 [Saprospiraceae bacterium]|nr:hypothetical protein [Saprospiraceae bacterium]MBK9564934.1 hypothetical protein [Saprospiraceae bacterium]
MLFLPCIPSGCYDINIIDTKLTKDTGFTPNQNKAEDKGPYVLRLKSFVETFNGDDISFAQGETSFSRSDDFINIFSDGNDVLQDID